MFFETTFVPSPPLSATTIDDVLVTDEEYESDIEPTSDKPVDHVIFVIHVTMATFQNIISFY
ncbi:hypothetical protein BDB01DRAFT_796310 [Pilobolus umbonatus]|nr:hypothetical protein BDB01DRAFT_796310 [Pilobolus umbonatus]